MNAIYTWHKDLKNKWLNTDFEIKSLLKTIRNSSIFFKSVILYTDEESLKYLDDCSLEGIKIVLKPRVLHKLWVMDKINTYSLQTEPFIHIDIDFIFTKTPNEDFLKNSVGFQHIDSSEESSWEFCYLPRIKNLVNLNTDITLNTNCAYNFGVYLCNDLKINERYCKETSKLSKQILEKTVNASAYNIVLEQYVMSSLLEKLKVIPMFLIDKYKEEEAKKIGFIHLMGNKKNKEHYERI
jgi:hypothetical protein